MTSLSIEDKSLALKGRPTDFENHLFFAARNLAIEAMMLRIETRMLRAGFDVSVHWREYSASAPTVELRLANPKPGTSFWEYATASISVKRERIAVYNKEQVSECFYSVKDVHPTEYWPGKQSKYVLGFRALVAQLRDEGYFHAEVNKVNYPFDRASHSGF